MEFIATISRGFFMSNSRFIKLIICEETDFLRENHPNAFLLLSLIAQRARRTSNHPDGLQIGEAHIGDFKKAGIETRQKYRTALQILISRKHVQKMETCRTRQKSTTGTTTEGTKIKLLRSDVWDINPQYENNIIHHPSTTEQPPSNHEQERKRKKKKEQEQTTTRAPLQKVEALNESNVVVDVDFSLENFKQEDGLMHKPPDKEIEDSELDTVLKGLGLTQLEKSFMSTYPIERIKLAVEYYKTIPVKTTWIQALRYHCNLPNPIFSPAQTKLKRELNMKINREFCAIIVKEMELTFENFKWNHENYFYRVSDVRGTSEDISSYEDPNVFKQMMTSALRKFGLWKPKAIEESEDNQQMQMYMV
jgi:hypothetical protein